MHLPLHVFNEVGEVSTVQGVEYVHLIAIVGPGAKGQVALLIIKGEVGDVHHTGAFGDGWCIPGDQPIIPQDHIGVHGLRRFIVSPGGQRRKIRAACQDNSPNSLTQTAHHHFGVFGSGPPFLSPWLESPKSTLICPSSPSPMTS